jgi:hypothetical protein
MDMNKILRNHIASIFLLAPAAATLVALPVGALAQQAAPEVRSLQVSADEGLEPGSRMTFTLVGTPRADAEVRVASLRDAIPMQETSRGVYVGHYTLRRGDRASPDSEVRATLRVGNRSSSASYALNETMGSRRAVAPPPPVRPVEPPLRIERFGMAQFDRLEPGTELRFALDGAPGGTVIIDLPGVANDVALREVRPGHYEGGYTVRRSDRFNFNQPLVATLRVGDRVVTSSMAFPQGSVREAAPAPRVPLPLPVPLPPPPAAVVIPSHPLAAELTSPLHNGDIGTDPVLIMGRTAPNATVFVTVHASAPPGVVLRDLPPILVRETVQADPSGAFRFQLNPQIPYPGVRYDITMVSSRGPVKEETRATLFQRGS